MKFKEIASTAVNRYYETASLDDLMATHPEVKEEVAGLRDDFIKFFKKALKKFKVKRVRDLSTAQKAELFSIIRDGWDIGKGVNSNGRKSIKGNNQVKSALKRHAGSIATHIIQNTPILGMIDAATDGKMASKLEDHMNNLAAEA